MVKRPSIALCCILKNEVKNLARLMKSVEGCFDEIHFTDTGSTDGSLELIRSWIVGENPAATPVSLHHFEWCDDFSKARNASFFPATTDYVMWLDLDDVLSDRDAFISWRDDVMKLAEFWIATYHYALDAEGKPICSFARERVIKNRLGMSWRYFLHEGILPTSPVKKDVVMQYAPTWSVKHLRDAEDLAQDKSRNLLIFDKHKGSLDARMRYYYGKELFETGKPLEAYRELMAAITEPALENHDRVMGIQFACLAAMQLAQWEQAISLAHQGLALSPQRAEFLCAIADCYLKQNRAGDAVPYYEAARKCGFGGASPIQGPIFQHEESYRHYPRNQLARIYAHSGDIDGAEKYVAEAVTLGPNAESMGIAKELEKVRAEIGNAPTWRRDTSDIVISTPPHILYEWDHDTYRTKGIGGSETAAVEMATHLAELTGRRVLVFNPRETTKTFGNVEYRPSAELPRYFRDYKPAVHIAWRHTLTLSPDPMYVWCHDLGVAGLERHEAYHRVLTLSPFHKGYVKNFFGVPEEKLLVTRNGIAPGRFLERREKEYGKVVFSSSPDRGLDRAIAVMDEVVKRVPEAKLHVYYGFENMLKMGMKAEHDRLMGLINARSHVVYHGNLPQSELTEEIKTACVWLYPTNFLETYCITAIEMLSANVFPVARRWGALADTLGNAALNGSADLIDSAAEDEESIRDYAAAVQLALKYRKWESMIVRPEEFSWASVAKEWVSMLGLNCEAEGKTGT